MAKALTKSLGLGIFAVCIALCAYDMSISAATLYAG